MKRLPCFTKPKNRNGYYYTPTVDGKTKWIPLGPDKQIALEKYHLLVGGLGRSNKDDPRSPTVNLGLDIYLSDGGGLVEKAVLERASANLFSTLSPATQHAYQCTIPYIRKEYGNRTLDSLTPGEVTRWVPHLSAGNRAISILNNVYTICKYARLVETNPLKGQVERLALAKRTRHVLTEELMAVRSVARPTLQVLMDIAMRTGLRVSDLLALDPSKIVGDHLVVEVQKTKRTGRVLRFRLDDGLRELVEQTPFISARKVPLRYGNLVRWWNRACADAGVTNLKIHDMRRWAIQQADALERGAGRRLADHSSENQTATYLGGAPVDVDTLDVSGIIGMTKGENHEHRV